MRLPILFTLVAAICLPASAQRPNFIIILADDLGYADLGSYRKEADSRTPHLDRLAAGGVGEHTDQLLRAGLPHCDGDQRRSVDDHVPSGPYPRIASSSATRA